MILRCPNCSTQMKPKPPASTKPGQTVQITCRCGQRIRFAMPKPAARTDWAKVMSGFWPDPSIGELGRELNREAAD